MDWNDPDNFQFPIRLLCEQVKRVKSFYLSYYVGQGQLYEWVLADSWYWWPDQPFAPAHTPLAWYPGVWDFDPNNPEAIPGPGYTLIPGGYDFFLNSAQTVTGYVTTFLEDIILKGLVPPGTTWSEVSEAFKSQTVSIIEPSSYPSPGPPGTVWRVGFVQEVLSRAKFVWESEPLVQPLDRYYIVFGRIPPEPQGSAVGLAYLDRVTWIEPLATTYKLYKLRCGRRSCCCCCC